MSASPAPRPLTDAEFNALSPDQLSALGFQPAQQGAPATFSGAVYPNPTNIKPVADTDIDKGEGTRLPTGVKMTYPISRGKPQMDTSNPASAQFLPSGSTTVQAKTTGTPVPADASLLEQLAGGQPPKTDGSLLEQIAAAPSGQSSGSSNGRVLNSYGDATLEGLDAVGRGAQGAVQGVYNLVRHPIDSAKAIASLPSQAAQVPSAVSDINQSSDPTGTYANAAKDTAGQAAGQTLLAVGTEGLGSELKGVDLEAFKTAAKQTAAKAGTKAFPGTTEALKFLKNYEDAKAAKATPETAPATAADAAPAKPTPSVKTAVTGTPAPGAPDVATANGYTRPAVLTNPQDIQSAVNDIVNGKTGRSAPLNSVELEKAMKSGQPIQTPVDVTEGARDLINKDVAKNVAAPKVKSPETVSKISGETEALRNRQTTVAGKEVSGDDDLTNALQKSIDAVKNNKPHWAYRTRDVGEEGVPDTDSHAHATSTLEDAKRLAPGKESVNGKPQEIVKFDLNKLKSHQYSTFSGPRGTPWIKVHGGIPEAAVEKVE